MLSIRASITTIKMFFGFSTIEGTINPVHVAVASHGYRIQSQKLGIPDRFGFFSPGPLQLQEHQGGVVALIVFALIPMIFWSVFIILMFKSKGKPVLGLIEVMMGMFVVWLGALWIIACFDRRRAPDYDWGARKLHQS